MNAINKNKIKILNTVFKEIIVKISLGEPIKPNDIFDNPKSFIEKAILNNKLLKEVWLKSNEGKDRIDINNLFLYEPKIISKRDLENFVILVNYQNSVNQD